MVKKEEERGCLENERSAISSSGSGDLMDEIDQVRKEEERERLVNKLLLQTFIKKTQLKYLYKKSQSQG